MCLKEFGHEVIYVGGGKPKMAEQALTRGPDLDGMSWYHINMSRLDALPKGLAELNPDAIHFHGFPSVEVVMYSDLMQLSGLWYTDPTLLSKPEPLKNVPWNLELEEWERHCSLPALSQWQLRQRDRHCEMAIRSNLFQSIATPTPAVSAAYKEWLGGGNFMTIPNSPFKGATADLNKDLLRAHLKITDDKPIVIFAGYGAPHRMWHHMAVACRQLDYHCVMVMEPRPNLPGFAEAHQISVDAGAMILPIAPYPLPSNPRPHLLDLLSGADVGFNGLDMSYFQNHKLALPSKFFEYAFAGLKIVTAATQDCTELTEKWGLGATYDGTLSGLIDKLKEVVEAPKRTEENVNAFINQYNYENTGARLLHAMYAPKP